MMVDRNEYKVCYDHIMKNGLIIDQYGTKIWYKDDEYHRDNGPAVEHISGNKYWFQNGTWHRIDGPAVINEHGKFWYQYGKNHRLDGPAMEYTDGYKLWYYQGEHIECKSQKEFERILRLKIFW